MGRLSGLAVLLAACLAACTPQAPQQKGERIISVAPNLTELLYAAGAADQLVAVSEYSDYPEAAKALPRSIRTAIRASMGRARRGRMTYWGSVWL